jgi:heat-inducible transcriptional repressor
VYQPHTSAGRIPTDTGYRAFVDDVFGAEQMPAGLSDEEARCVRSTFEDLERELDDVLRETAAVLSNLTSYVAVVAAPALARAHIRRASLVGLGPKRALVVVVTDSGQVADRAVEFAAPVAPEALARVEGAIGQSIEGRYGDEVADVRRALDGAGGSDVDLARTVLDAVIDCLAEADCDRVLTGGASALLSHPEFADPHAMRPMLGLLEDGLAMLRVFSECMRSPSVEVRIGHENSVGALGHASFVASRYGDGDRGGIVGVIGPTRMDYRRAVGAVRTVSDALTDAIDS